MRFASVMLAVVLGGAASCTFRPNSPLGGDGQGGAAGSSDGMGGSPSTTGAGGRGGGTPGPMCTGLQCQQTSCRYGACTGGTCTGSARTTVSGTVYDPAGKVPLYNVLVYVPNAELAPLTDGASCDRCATSASGNPLTKATTDARGQFMLDDVPVGSDIPLVLQVGKWRRAVKIPAVTGCVDNPLMDKELTRLPRNQSEGNIPKIALTTGNWDALECLLRKVGIEDTEFTPETGMGRVNLFNGNMGTDRYIPTLNGGAMFTPAPTWWENQANLMAYDLVLHSCEGVENSTNKSQAARAALQAYADAGGRVFASHWHNFWIEQGPMAFAGTAQFRHQGDPPSPFTATIDTSFPKGMAMADWLMNVQASTTLGQLSIIGAKHTVTAVTPNVAQRWIYSDAMPGAMETTLRTASVQYFSFNTPVGAVPGAECGKVVFSDLHLAGAVGNTKGADLSQPDRPFPTGCTTTELSPQEKALEFMLFDLSACLDPTVP